MSTQADHFARFQLPRRYPVDRAALEAAYERLTLAHHPDFFSTAPEAERREAERVAAAVNEGYRVLCDDAARADYLLRLLAGDRELDTRSLTPEFLQEMFALQEEAEELLEQHDAPGIREMRRKVQAEQEAVRAHLAGLFDRMSEPPPVAALQAVQTDLNTERYLQRLLERLDGVPAE